MSGENAAPCAGIRIDRGGEVVRHDEGTGRRMSDWMSGTGSRVPAGAQVDPDTPSVARMYDFFLGGEDNFAADRKARAQVTSFLDGGPGVVRLHEWRPEGGEYATDAGWTAVARTPG
jgi:hypothetical protein